MGNITLRDIGEAILSLLLLPVLLFLLVLKVACENTIVAIDAFCDWLDFLD